jgi:hypothetical protein
LGVTLKTAVRGTPSISDSYRSGLSALRKSDRDRISAESTRFLTGSIDLDLALKRVFPNAPRWDYGIGYRVCQERIFWIEVHPSRSSSDIEKIEKKARWLKQWLDSDGRLLRPFPRQLVWISSGKTTFTSTSPQGRRIAQAGVFPAGGRYTIK